ncbi:hypothetical protein PM082_007043 [Marasmius tenuissimus]|nr:hypothetical protein PM082_007043 [Marasmius tenuissimus]
MPERSSFPTATNGEPSCSSSELRVVPSRRDHNVNNGSGNFNVHNTSVIQQAKRIRWYIQGTDEEEEEYDQYNEYRRSDIRLLRKIHHEILGEWDRETRRYVPLDCERSVWLGEIMSGDQKGTIVTVVGYQGRNASEEWKSNFKCYSINLLEDSAHLVGLNRSKIPQLILLGELVPAAVFAKSLGVLCLMYLQDIYRHFGCTDEELWMDTGRGVLCRGPKGPSHQYHGGLVYDRIENPVATADVFKEDVLIRYLASQNSGQIDRGFISGMFLDRDDVDVPEWVDRPTVFCTLTNTPIAVARNIWSTSSDSLKERTYLGNGCARFRLEDGHTHLELWLNLSAEQAWLSQASSVFHARGIPLEKDLGAFTLVTPTATLEGTVSESEDECFNPTTTDFYRHIAPNHFDFCPINASDRFEAVHQDYFSDTDTDTKTAVDSEESFHKDFDVSTASSNGNTGCEPTTSEHADNMDGERFTAREGGIEDRPNQGHVEQDICRKIDYLQTVEEPSMQLKEADVDRLECRAEQLKERLSLHTTVPGQPHPLIPNTRPLVQRNFFTSATRLRPMDTLYNWGRFLSNVRSGSHLCTEKGSLDTKPRPKGGILGILEDLRRER